MNWESFIDRCVELPRCASVNSSRFNGGAAPMLAWGHGSSMEGIMRKRPPGRLSTPMITLIDVFEQTLRASGLHAALGVLNARTTHRFTGVYRYDGDWLRNVALFDRWNPRSEGGADAPMRETFCAIVPSQGLALEVVDGSTDARFPWMNENAVVSYCGTLIRSETGDSFGTLCHFDLSRCEAAASQLLPVMTAAAPLIYRAIAAVARPREASQG